MAAKSRDADEDALVFELREQACQKLSVSNQHFCTDSTLKVY